MFQAFTDCFKAFEKVCGLEHFDGKWISPVVDHMTELLVAYAEDADEETLQNPYQLKQATADSIFSESQKVEKAQTLMESLFRKLIHGQKNPPDNRRFAAYFLALRVIRV